MKKAAQTRGRGALKVRVRRRVVSVGVERVVGWGGGGGGGMEVLWLQLERDRKERVDGGGRRLPLYHRRDARDTERGGRFKPSLRSVVGEAAGRRDCSLTKER